MKGIKIANIRKNAVFLSIAGVIGVYFILSGFGIEMDKYISSGVVRIGIGVAILVIFGIGLKRLGGK